MIEKVINAEVKAGIQPSFRTKKINFRYSKRYRPLIKKNKDNAYQKQRNEATNRDKKKAKSHNPYFSANQPQIQASNFKKHPK